MQCPPPIQAHIKAKSNAVKPTVFLEIHKDIWPIVLPLDSVSKVMAETHLWEKVEADLQRVINSSSLGKRLFSFAVQHMLSQIVSKKMSQAVDEVWKLPEVTLASIREQKRDILEALEMEDNIDLMPARRELQMMYRGVPVQVKVSSMAEQFDLLVAARAKGEACALGTLVGLFCESDLVAKTKPSASRNHINPEVLQEAAEARAVANGLLHGDSCKDGDSICVICLVGFGGQRYSACVCYVPGHAHNICHVICNS